jgi:diguanylate cyclase (GGDEF)-like protein/PAS domain S-box-containing protein
MARRAAGASTPTGSHPDAPVDAPTPALGVVEAFYASLVESLPQPIFRKDLQGRFTFANHRFCELHGLTIEEMVGKTSFDLYPPELAEVYSADDRRVIEYGETVDAVVEHRIGGGPTRFEHVIKSPVRDANGVVVGVQCMFWDVTASARADLALRESEERFALFMDASPAVAFVKDENGRYVYVNRAFERSVGMRLAELEGVTDFELYPAEVAESLRANDQLVLLSGAPLEAIEAVPIADGRTRDWSVHKFAFTGASGERYLGGMALDVTERKRAEEALAHLAMHDPLTELPNRALLRDRLQQAILVAQRERKPLALMLMDLDHFKEVNDSLGHGAGDLLLQQVARRVRNALRASDTVARLGGDEFAALLPGVEVVVAGLTAAKLLQALQAPFTLEGHEIEVGASVGIAIFPEHGEDAETLMRRADVAMYAAKRSGGGLHAYTSELDVHSPTRLSMTSDLRKAIELDQLVLHFQPLVDLKSRRVVSVEALVRWEHSERGTVPPAQFIPLAEQTGLMKTLDLWVLNAALRQCRQWQNQGMELPVAVNLSMRNLHDPGLPDAVANLLDTWDLAPYFLGLEITESALMADPARAMDNLARLRALSIHIAIDDFGTGYSSLAYLKWLLVDVLKLDRSFIFNVADDRRDRAIVRAAVDLGHELGLMVVGEGIEDERTWNELAGLGCDMAQGYYLTKPLPPDELLDWAREWAASSSARR